MAQILFARNEATTGTELWVSDGSPGNTQRLTDISPGSASSSPMRLTKSNGKIFFDAQDASSQNGSTNTGLWVTDGTPGGTQKLTGSFNAPLNLTDVNGTLFFDFYNNATFSYELWKSAGTPATTSFVSSVASTSYLANVNGKLFFFDGSGHLLTSNGTGPGTTQVGTSTYDLPGGVGGRVRILSSRSAARSTS